MQDQQQGHNMMATMEKVIKKTALAETHLREAASTITSVERHQMIATSAYYRAEHRTLHPAGHSGFVAGDSLKDWLDAESEITARFF